MSLLKLRTIAIITVMIVILAVMPMFLSTYILTFLSLLLTYMIIAESYDMVGGLSGYMNLGHAVFFGISAYLFAVMVNYGINAYVAGITGVVGAVIFSLFISYPLFRLRGGYFAIASIAVDLFAMYLITNLRDITGGAHGITVPFRETVKIGYWLALAIAIGCVIHYYIIARSKFGLALASIKEDEEVAQHFGIALYKTKVKILVIGAFWTGLIGPVFMYSRTYITPSVVFGLDNALAPVIMALLGGSGLWYGPVFGAIILGIIQELLWVKIPYFHLFIYGLAMVLIGIVLPGGILRATYVRRIVERKR